MALFTVNVTIEANTREQADMVLAERLGYDEDYGFDYSIGYGSISGSGEE